MRISKAIREQFFLIKGPAWLVFFPILNTISC